MENYALYNIHLDKVHLKYPRIPRGSVDSKLGICD